MSTSTTLWATASKEWIIQPKPKPGRKPKKDPPTSANTQDEDDAKGRRIQNRAAQRAFRERKQSQLAELQARILSYEQGEIERNVALQKIAKRLKEENERLLQENAALKEKIARLEEQQTQPQQENENDKKRLRDDSESPSDGSKSRPQRKRSRTSATPPTNPDTSNLSVLSPSPLVSTPESSISAESQFSAQFTLPSDPHNTLTDILDFSSNMKDMNVDSVTTFTPFGCGFCSDSTPCMCRELALNTSGHLAPFKNDFSESPLVLEDTSNIIRQNNPDLPQPSQPSILENLPAYQPPVPLRRRTDTGKSPVKPIFQVFPVSDSEGQGTSGPTCSGDPSNCAACNDDEFGKAFCSAIEETVNARPGCSDCPSGHLDGSLQTSHATSPQVLIHEGPEGGCCLKSVLEAAGCVCASSGLNDVSPPADEAREQYIPTNDAWRQIKSHPNVQFADLSLLAEVVASRSKCSGPRIVVSPPPEDRNQSGGNAANTDPNVPPRNTSPPRLIPQEVLLECGRRRVRQVHSEAVRDALRLLDAKFT